jgi:hypothetical protein
MGRGKTHLQDANGDWFGGYKTRDNYCFLYAINLTTLYLFNWDFKQWQSLKLGDIMVEDFLSKNTPLKYQTLPISYNEKAIGNIHTMVCRLIHNKPPFGS